MKKKKYFVGGTVNQALQATGNTIGMPGQSSQMIGGAAQAGIGALSANPQDIISGAGSMLSGGISNAATTFKNEDAGLMDKALAAYGVINPVAGVASSFRNQSLLDQQENQNAMNNVIKRNNMMEGGGLIPRQAYAVNNSSPAGIKRPPTNYPPMSGIPVQGIPQQQPSGNLAPIPQINPNEIRRLNSVKNYNLGRAYDEELQDYYLNANPQIQNDIGRSITNRPAANPGQVEQGIQNDLDVIRQSEGRKREPARLFADGGKLNSFDGGFTHQDNNPQNMFEGIPQGMTANGDMNTVEQGETRWEDYIFSDQLKLNKDVAKQLGLKKSDVGKTFATLSKKYNKESEDRPNDPITKNTTELNMQNLMAANQIVKNVEEPNKFAKGGSIKYDTGSWLDFLNQFKQPDTSPEQGIPYRYNSEMNAQQQPAIDPTNYFNINELYSQNPTDSTGVLNSLIDPNASTNLQQQGYTLGANNVVKQRQTEGFPGFAGGLTPQDYANADPEFMNNLFPEGFKGTPEEIAIYKEAVLADPARASQVSGKPGDRGYGLLGQDWLQKVNQEPLMPLMSGKDFRIPNKGPEEELAPIPQQPPESPVPPGNTATPPKDLPNLWPELGAASQLAAMGMLDPQYMTPSTMSSGYLRPQMVDEQTMRSNIDAANRANVGALNNVTGGSGSAQRAGLLGQGSNYMGATGNAFMQANQANNAARMQADQFNIGNQSNVNARNMSALNNANAMNTGIANQYNMEKADTFAGVMGDYSQAGYNRRKESDQGEAIANALWYDRMGRYVGNQQQNAYGGMIKSRKRKLK